MDRQDADSFSQNDNRNIKRELKEQLNSLQQAAQQEFDIEISASQMLQDKAYFQLVINELSALEHDEISGIIAEIKQLAADLRKRPDSAPVTAPAAPIQAAAVPQKSDDNQSKLLIYAVLGMSVVLLAVVIYLMLMPKTVTAPATSVAPPTVAATAPVQTSAPAATAEPKGLTLPVSNPVVAFRLHGSNTIGEKLAPALLEAYLKTIGVTEFYWKKGAVAVERELQYIQDGKVFAIELHAHGSSTGFKGLKSGKADMGMSSRPVKPTEIEDLKAAIGDLSKVGNEHIIGLDGLAVIVNQNNSISSLDSATLARIFAGEISNWKQVGGADMPIKLFARDSKSGTWDTFKNLVLKKYGKKLAEGATRLESSSELSTGVSADEGAIGFIGLNYVGHSKAISISEGQDTAAIFPTRFTVGTEDYALSRRLFFYTPTTASNLIKDFASFAISRKGQDIVEEIGLISQNIKVEKVYAASDAPAKYNQYTEKGQRLSLNFRFNHGDKELDNKGKRDLERLISYMEKNAGRRVVLMGFADSVGKADRNRWLSLNRARVVERELVSRGINVLEVEAFGEALPVANNNSEAGRARNRRVEVWVL
ncbi:phosphate ABC transporter substrate-binding/OmpA family protein [Corallincola platygyrae]|uniref:Phosphate ABC transporter substrate-binding/OmpA family protein n=1 Tax=Corallincola platygyrae TaxID=1193278 RepID=A0ABW4XIE4_9GAMM